jgi:hypothetical protein
VVGERYYAFLVSEVLVPLYFFHLRNGEDRLLDPEGAHLADFAAITARALREARNIMGNDIMASGRLDLGYHIDVEDEGGAVVHRLAFPDALCATKGDMLSLA